MVRCKHCKSTFVALRRGHIYCSETCRKLSHKAKNKAIVDSKRKRRITAKLQKLANCSFGRYLIGEVRRAGTVEVLQGHTTQTLKELVALRRKCTTSGGYEKGEPRGTYELSHVWPVAATQYLGLLTTANLVITPKQFNRTHAQKSPVTGYLGKSIPRACLQVCWLVPQGMDTTKVLKLIRAYLGDEFDQWLSGFVISLTRRDTLIKQLRKAGLPLRQLQELSLQQLKTLADEEDVSYFDIDKEPEDLRSVLFEELNRLGLAPEISKALELLYEEDWSLGWVVNTFSGTKEEQQEFVEMLIEQALKCLHGQPHTDIWRDKPVLDWLPPTASAPHQRRGELSTVDDDDDDDIL
jgi:hypothetical protein